MSQILKDRLGRKIGEIKESGGVLTIYDRLGRKLGYYKNGITYDRLGRKVATGNMLTNFLEINNK